MFQGSGVGKYTDNNILRDGIIDNTSIPAEETVSCTSVIPQKQGILLRENYQDF